VHNLVGGTVRLEPVMDRATPYHRPHSAQVAGYAVIYGGDDRYVGNVFLGGDAVAAYGPAAFGSAPAGYGTAGYDGHPKTLEEYLARVATAPGGDHRRFPGVKQPACLRDNVYGPGARPFAGEASALTLTQEVSFEVADEGDEGDEVYLEARLPAAFGGTRLGVVTGADLPRVRFADADFEERDGSPVVVDVDLLGERKSPGHGYPAGPIANLPQARHAYACGDTPLLIVRPRMSGQGEEELLHLRDVGLAWRVAVGQAVLKPGGHDRETATAERLVDGRELGEHVLAFGSFLQHPDDAAQVTVGALHPHDDGLHFIGLQDH